MLNQQHGQKAPNMEKPTMQINDFQATTASDANISSATNRQAVLVEVLMDQGNETTQIFQMVNSGFTNSGFQVDTNYPPVPMSPDTPELQAQLQSDHQQIVIVRGFVNEQQLSALEAQPNVLSVNPDTPIEPFSTTTLKKSGTFVEPVEAFATCPIGTCDCSSGTAKGTIEDVAKYLGADHIWSAGFRGEDIVIGVVDGGITAQGRPVGNGETSRRISRVIGGWPTSDWGTKAARWGEHGNMCATDVLGMAPKSQIYDIRISDGSAISSALAGFQWAINQHKRDGTPQILTNSWGIFQEEWDSNYARNPNHPFTRKVVEAINEGILVLFAAGNCGATCADGRCGSDTGPGKSIWGANGHPLVMTVGAVNKNEQFVGYSSQGPAALDPRKPDFCSITHFRGYFPSDSGTSAATPIAAGVVALLKQANPSLSQSEIKRGVMDTAKDIGPRGWDQHSGAGILQAKAAFEKLVGLERYSGVFRQGSGGYALWVGATWSNFVEKWQELSGKGLRLIDLNIVGSGAQARYSGVFREGSGGYALWVGATWSNFVEKWQELSGKGLRLIDLEIVGSGSQARYSGVFIEGSGGYALWAGATWSSFVAKWQELSGKGLRLIDLNIVGSGSQARYSGVFREGSGGYALWVGATWSNFVSKWQELSNEGLRLTDLEVVGSGSQTRYSGVFSQGSGGYALWAGASRAGFLSKWKELSDKGLRLIDLEITQVEHPASSNFVTDGAATTESSEKGQGIVFLNSDKKPESQNFSECGLGMTAFEPLEGSEVNGGNGFGEISFPGAFSNQEAKGYGEAFFSSTDAFEAEVKGYGDVFLDDTYSRIEAEGYGEAFFDKPLPEADTEGFGFVSIG
jgi:subtilisin family serine protease